MKDVGIIFLSAFWFSIIKALLFSLLFSNVSSLKYLGFLLLSFNLVNCSFSNSVLFNEIIYSLPCEIKIVSKINIYLQFRFLFDLYFLLMIICDFQIFQNFIYYFI